MPYAIKEIFKTLQGEGARAGRAAVFCRFAGCNLWTGREADRQSASCPFCDTDFVGVDGPDGGRFPDADSLADRCVDSWGPDLDLRYVVLTGGEPMLQVDEPLVRALHRRGFQVAIETNGTVPIPFRCIDWVTVSPKAGAELVIFEGQELKVVYPQEELDPVRFLPYADDFRFLFIQPKDGPDLAENTRRAVAYCLDHPRWGLSLQMHKILGIR